MTLFLQSLILWVIFYGQMAMAVEPVAPTKIRVVAAADRTITVDFFAVGDQVEVEQFRSGKWVRLTPPLIKDITTPTPNGCYEITAPTRKGSANQTRLCAIGNGTRACAKEGIYAQC